MKRCISVFRENAKSNTHNDTTGNNADGGGNGDIRMIDELEKLARMKKNGCPLPTTWATLVVKTLDSSLHTHVF